MKIMVEKTVKRGIEGYIIIGFEDIEYKQDLPPLYTEGRNFCYLTENPLTKEDMLYMSEGLNVVQHVFYSRKEMEKIVLNIQNCIEKLRSINSILRKSWEGKDIIRID